jgi:excisionase family DNA binding protein
METNQLLTVEELAQHLQVHQQTVRRWIKEGKLPAIKLGESRTAHYRITERDATRFLNQMAASLIARNLPQGKEPGHVKRD